MNLDGTPLRRIYKRELYEVVRLLAPAEPFLKVLDG
jgi:hypothetical protein